MRDLKTIISQNEAAEQSWQARWLRLKREVHDRAAYSPDINSAKVLMAVEKLMQDIEEKR